MPFLKLETDFAMHYYYYFFKRDKTYINTYLESFKPSKTIDFEKCYSKTSVLLTKSVCNIFLLSMHVDESHMQCTHLSFILEKIKPKLL